MTIYLVNELLWSTATKGTQFIGFYPNADGGSRPIRAFMDRDKAEKFCKELEKQSRDRKNPFFYGRSFEELSSFLPEIYADWLLDAGIDPPEKPSDDVTRWREWVGPKWDALTTDQVAHLWEGLNRIQFYEITDMELWSGNG